MPSSDSLERPAEWLADSGLKHKVALAFVALLGTACVPVGIGFALIGLPEASKYAPLFGVLFFLTASFGLVSSSRRQRHRVDGLAIITHDGEPATEIRYSRAAFVIIAGLMACLAMICALAALDFAFAGTDIPGAAAGAALSGLASLFFLSFFTFAAAGRLRPGGIVLSARGIHQRGRSFSSYLPWEAFAGVKAAYNGIPEVLVIAFPDAPWERHQLGGVWKLDKLPPVPMIEIDTTVLAVDPTLVYHLVRFYVENPAARAELGTERSLDRARSGTYGE